MRLGGWPVIAAFAVLVLLPFVPGMSRYYLLLAFDALLFGGIAMSLDLLMGYTGLVSFGHAAFYGLGAYATARRGIYFALLTLIFAEVVYTFFRYTQTFGGSDGIQGLPDAYLFPDVPLESAIQKYYLVLAYLTAAYLVCRTLVTSHFGRVLVAIRENEDRARFLGYDVQGYKVVVCVVSALLTGLGGAIYPMRSAFATPDLLLWTESGEFIISVMIGGLGTLVGPIIGGAFFTILRDKVSSYVDWYFIVIGAVLIVIVLAMPKGLLGLRRLFPGPRAA